jgi:hypothetical protein
MRFPVIALTQFPKFVQEPGNWKIFKFTFPINIDSFSSPRIVTLRGTRITSISNHHRNLNLHTLSPSQALSHMIAIRDSPDQSVTAAEYEYRVLTDLLGQAKILWESVEEVPVPQVWSSLSIQVVMDVGRVGPVGLNLIGWEGVNTVGECQWNQESGQEKNFEIFSIFRNSIFDFYFNLMKLFFNRYSSPARVAKLGVWLGDEYIGSVKIAGSISEGFLPVLRGAQPVLYSAGRPIVIRASISLTPRSSEGCAGEWVIDVRGIQYLNEEWTITSNSPRGSIFDQIKSPGRLTIPIITDGPQRLASITGIQSGRIQEIFENNLGPNLIQRRVKFCFGSNCFHCQA